MAQSLIHLFLLLLSMRCVKWTWCDMRDFSICHDDSSLNPPDGVVMERTFPWLCVAQYLHVTTGLLHQSQAPRAVLIQKQFVISTASGMLQLPKNYKLGNMVFGDYERDEKDCGLTQQEINMGSKCSRAFLEVPILVVYPHPEYASFGVGNSLALVKLLLPVKSNYMIPLCLPSFKERVRKKKDKAVWLIDYLSTVPRDFDTENVGKKTLKLYTHRDCYKLQINTKLRSQVLSQALCSSGCGVRAGAPIISRSESGRFELVGLAAGGPRCGHRSMRNRLNKEPPLYIDVFPYSSWIVNTITAHSIPKSYPQQSQMAERATLPDIRTKKPEKCRWNARIYMCGNFCFRSKKTLSRAAFFYKEKFSVNSAIHRTINIQIKISAGIECTIVCARLLLPSRVTTPTIDGIGTYNITVTFTTDWFPSIFAFTLELHGKNTTAENLQRWLPHVQKNFS